MSFQNLVCTGCGCLCDDIRVEIDGANLGRIENACAKGATYLRSSFDPQRRAEALIRGQRRSLEEAIQEAVHLLSKAKNLLVFGLDNSTLESQAVAIDLVKRLGGTIDDASSFSYGVMMQKILTEDLPTCALSEVKDNADLLIYWGANPPHTHPRHLSKYTYYAYADYNPAGWYPKVTLSCVEVRQTELSSMCKPPFRIKPGQDKGFINTILDEGQNAREEARKFREMVAKSRFCVIFCGLGLIYSLDNDLTSFSKMVHTFSQSTRVAVIPMIAEANMRGFHQSLYKQTGYVNSISFAGSISHRSEFSLLEQVRNRVPECLLIMGADPFSALPQSIMKNLQGINVICLDHFRTPTTISADVVIPTALPGVEYGGSMIRMDGAEVALAGPKKVDQPTEEEVLKQLAGSI